MEWGTAGASYLPMFKSDFTAIRIFCRIPSPAVVRSLTSWIETL